VDAEDCDIVTGAFVTGCAAWSAAWVAVCCACCAVVTAWVAACLLLAVAPGCAAIRAAWSAACWAWLAAALLLGGGVLVHRDRVRHDLA